MISRLKKDFFIPATIVFIIFALFPLIGAPRNRILYIFLFFIYLAMANMWNLLAGLFRPYFPLPACVSRTSRLYYDNWNMGRDPVVDWDDMRSNYCCDVRASDLGRCFPSKRYIFCHRHFSCARSS
jgi:hypothetical protein